MEKNLPFVNLSILDKGYDKIIIPFLGKLDDGNVFKNIIVTILYIISIIILLGGVYLAISNIFGEEGFIKLAINNENVLGWQKFASIIGLIIGFVTCLFTVWVLYSILKKRTEQLNSKEYVGLLDYIFTVTMPSIIIIIGEIVFVLALYLGLMQIIAALIGSYVYAPLGDYSRILLGIFPVMDIFGSFVPREIYASYEYFTVFLKMGFFGVLGSFIILIAFYIYCELYKYVLKLVKVFIAFLPKFAIPLAIRNRNEN